MKTHAIPKTIQRWLDANADKVAEYFTEEDCYGESRQGPISVWCYLKRPYMNGLTETSSIHAASAKDFLEDAAFVEENEDWWNQQYGPAKVSA
jgi:hypothetical protein